MDLMRQGGWRDRTSASTSAAAGPNAALAVRTMMTLRPRVAGVVSAARRGEGASAARGGAEDKLALQVGASWHKVKSITRDVTRITSPSTYTVLFGDSEYEGYKT